MGWLVNCTYRIKIICRACFECANQHTVADCFQMESEPERSTFQLKINGFLSPSVIQEKKITNVNNPFCKKIMTYFSTLKIFNVSILLTGERLIFPSSDKMLYCDSHKLCYFLNTYNVKSYMEFRLKNIATVDTFWLSLKLY